MQSNTNLEKINWKKRFLIVFGLCCIIGTGLAVANLLQTYHISATNQVSQIKLFLDANCTQETPLTFKLPGIWGNATFFTFYAKNLGNYNESIYFNTVNVVGAEVLLHPYGMELDHGAALPVTIEFENVTAPISFDLTVSDAI